MFLIREIDFIDLGNNEIFMLNLINAAADIITHELYNDIVNNSWNKINDVIINAMFDRKYLFKAKTEYDIFIDELDRKIDSVEENSKPSFLIVPTYTCNLQCIYCYEQTYMIEGTADIDPIKMVDFQFEKICNLVDEYYSVNNKFTEDIRITIMGGEPLLKGNIGVIAHILTKANEKKFSVDIVTNGVDLNHFIELFNKYKGVLQHIQITLDGIKEVHDTRRIFHDGSGSFDLILSNIKIALNNDIKTYLRVNVDKSNINELPLLANILTDKFGVNERLKPYLYLLQDGGCSGEADIISETIGIEKIFELERHNPNIKIFHKKYHPAEFIKCIFENIPYHPILRHCGASKNQYIFDCKSNIYKCWHGIGNNNYRVGVFDPQYILSEEKVSSWKNRSVKNISKCKKCKYRYICGTGCPAAKHISNSIMNIDEPSCVDYKTLINILITEKMKEKDVSIL